MSKQLPCPNPVCTHIFSAQEVQSAEMLKCPRCGRAYRFRPPAPTAPASQPPTGTPVAGKPGTAPRANSPAAAKPPAPKPAPKTPLAAPAPPRAAPVAPMAAPVAAQRPATPFTPPVAPLARPVVPLTESVDVETVAEPVPEPDDPFAVPSVPVLEDDVPLVRSRGLVKNHWTAKHYVVLGFALIMLGTLVSGAIIYRGDIRDLFTQTENVDERARPFSALNLANKEERVFRLAAPARWTADKTLRDRFQARTAWKHDEGDAWFAIAVQDYGQQRPRDSEMMRAAVERLESHFGDGLELAKNPFKSELVGEECQCLPFKGTFNSVTWYGECYLLAYHGFGYWLFVASSSRWGSPEDAASIKAELEKSKSFALETERKGWREQPPKMEPFVGKSAPVSISVISGAWEKSPANDVEETGEIFLFGRFVREKDNRKNASILVFTVEKKAGLKESLRDARAYLEKRRQDENAKYRYLVAEDGMSESGASETVGDRAGYQVELKLMHGDEPRRYALLAAVHHDDRAFIVLCDCAWEHRQIWQQDFRNALGTLKFAKKE